MKKNRRTLLEIMVENGNSTEEIMKYKDCWGWKETTVEDYQEKMRKEMEKRKNSPRRNYKLNSIQSDLRWIKHQLERLERKIEDIDD